MRWNKIWLLTGLFFLRADTLLAQAEIPLDQSITQQAVSRPLVLLLVLVGLSLIPFVVMMTTSFVKIAVVLSLIRNAMGTQQIPPNPIITGLAMILTIYIMIPVGLQVYQVSGDIIQKGTNQPILSQASVNVLLEGVKKGKEPVREFLLKNAHEKERALFFTLSKKMRPAEFREEVGDKDFVVLIPAFVISELTEAFQIGFIIFLPFLIIDMVVTNILLSLGMFQISPITVSLPFKLLLFVLVDGWHLIAKGLIMGYM
ncbi:MAG: type III secretion system export apparatus subunit SctR [Deltaproteobacteria bacterium]|nr:type III secretion system export apparatus subunit SctR [Deltaproteobacteria bacterium]